MRRHLWWTLGLALVVGGVVLVIACRAAPTDFGWFAYTPLDTGPDWQMGWPDSPASAVIVSPWQVAGAASAVLGLVVVGAGTGYRLGRRRGSLSPGA